MLKNNKNAPDVFLRHFLLKKTCINNFFEVYLQQPIAMGIFHNHKISYVFALTSRFVRIERFLKKKLKKK